MIKTLLTFVLTAAFATATFAGELDLAIKATRGQQAQFTHRFTPKGFKKEQVERGGVVFGVPPQMRWTYRTPESKVFVFDGRTSWFYTAADRQVMVTKLDAKQQQSVPFAFLWDSDAAKNWSSTERRRGDVIDLSLQSRVADAFVKTVRLSVGAKDHRIRRLDYTDRAGNRTVFEFTAYSPFRGNTNSTFSFTPPPGVEVVQN